MPGATNALRTQGKAFGLSVLILDIGKGSARVAWSPALILPGGDWTRRYHVTGWRWRCGFCGHRGPRLSRLVGFRGGKGVATVSV